MINIFATFYRLTNTLCKSTGETFWSLFERVLGLFASVFGIIEFFKNWWAKKEAEKQNSESEEPEEKKEGSSQPKDDEPTEAEKKSEDDEEKN